jgi:AmmeMemoRadiSam system protein B
MILHNYGKDYLYALLKKAMKKISFILYLIFVIMSSCKNDLHESGNKVRPLKDTVGFAQYSWQMDSLMARMGRTGWKRNDSAALKLAICPHDDYTYTGTLYPVLLQNVKARTIFLIGVAHSAARMGIEDSLVFDSFDYWKGPWKNVPVSQARAEVLFFLKGKYAIVNDSLHKMEHSLEAMIPFLQYFDKDISIIPVLVPAMSPARMDECGKALAEAIRNVADKHGWEWGSDYAIVATTDAVHYGNEDWGGKDMAFFGCDEEGNKKALAHEYEIINSSLIGTITPEKIRLFNSLTINENNFHEYKWTWCGRYSVPVALYSSMDLSGNKTIAGKLIGYSTSISSDHIPVDDLIMGRTAIATNCHWVGYAAIAYR